jgi:hypothetical protein
MEIHKDQLIALVRKSVEETLRREFDGNFSFEIEEGQKNLLVLVPDFVVQLHSQLDSVVKAHKDYKIFLCSYKPLVPSLENDCVISANIRDDSVREAVIDRLNAFKKICVFNTGIRQLNRIVSGDEDDFASKIILLGLLHDKQILLHFDYNPFASKSPMAEETVRLIHSAESMKILVSYPGSEKRQGEEQTGLITQKDVDDLWQAGGKEISVSPKCIITPLAKDRIRELKIRIIPS